MYILLAFIVILAILSLPFVKGYFGELAIRILLNLLNKDKYKIINNVLIPSGDDKTAQIDHIVVSAFGIFVIETKNYKGWIFGSENSQYWTQVIYKKKSKFYNPILQNQGHVIALQNLLVDYQNIKYISIVVFTLRAVFKELSLSSHVVYSFGLLRTIKKYTEEVISKDDIEKISQVIITANSHDKLLRKEHVIRIQENKFNSQKVNGGICPWCGGYLVERQGKYGRFIGCNNFPKCKYTLKG